MEFSKTQSAGSTLPFCNLFPLRQLKHNFCRPFPRTRMFSLFQEKVYNFRMEFSKTQSAGSTLPFCNLFPLRQLKHNFCRPFPRTRMFSLFQEKVYNFRMKLNINTPRHGSVVHFIFIRVSEIAM